MSDKNKYAYHKTRLDILGHIEAGRLIGDKWSVYSWLMLKAAKEQNPGWFASNAPTIASHTHMTKRRAQDAMSYLRAQGYIYFSGQGKKGPFIIFINKWEMTFHAYKDDQSTFVPYRTNLWDQDGKFIGEDLFFARIIVRKLRQNYGLTQGLIRGLSERLNGDSSDFKSVLQLDFAEMSQVIDKHMKINGLLPYLSDFTRDYPSDFHRTMKAAPYLINNIYINKELAHDPAIDLSNDLKKEIKEKLLLLRGIWSNFNPYTFTGWYRKKRQPASLLLHILNYLLTKTNDSSFNAYGYAQTTIRNEKEKFNAELSRKESEKYKAEMISLDDFLKIFEVYENEVVD